MANFLGHSIAATSTGFIGATICPPQYQEAIILCGVFGGIAPDIDIGGFKSPAIPNIIFKIASLIILMNVFKGLSLIEQVALSVISCTAFWWYADWSMRHRGVTHTWLGALCTGLVVCYFAVRFTSPQIAVCAFWVAFCAHMQHLVIDDLTSGVRAISKGKKSKIALVSIRPVTFKSPKELTFIFLVVAVFGVLVFK